MRRRPSDARHCRRPRPSARQCAPLARRSGAEAEVADPRGGACPAPRADSAPAEHVAQAPPLRLERRPVCGATSDAARGLAQQCGPCAHSERCAWPGPARPRRQPPRSPEARARRARRDIDHAVARHGEHARQHRSLERQSCLGLRQHVPAMSCRDARSGRRASGPRPAWGRRRQVRWPVSSSSPTSGPVASIRRSISARGLITSPCGGRRDARSVRRGGADRGDALAKLSHRGRLRGRRDSGTVRRHARRGTRQHHGWSPSP